MRLRLPKLFRKGKGNVLPKPLKVASDSDLRPVLMDGWLDIENGEPVIITTDSYCIARIPVLRNGPSSEDFEPGVLPHEALEYMQRTKAQDFEVYPDEVKVGRVASFRRITVGEYPKWRELFGENLEPKEPLVIGFNASMLKRIADALGTESFQVTIDLDKIDRPEGGPATYLKPLVLRPEGAPADDLRLAMQMPIRVLVR
jgi:hypothetical protein